MIFYYNVRDKKSTSKKRLSMNNVKKPVYMLCPRCEINYIQKKDKFCDVCKREMKPGALEDVEIVEDDFDLELCPVCKINYITDGENMCQSCMEKTMEDENDENVNWREFLDKADDDEDDDDILPIVDEDDIDPALDNEFAKDLSEDEDFKDDLEEEEDDEEIDALDDDFDLDDLDDIDLDDDEEEDDDDDFDDDDDDKED